jgi:hypothetical protein
VRRKVTVTRLRGSFEGVSAHVSKGTRRGRVSYVVTIDMRGLNRGIYVARVRYRQQVGSGPVRKNTKVHYYRPCYGNPKGGLHAGANRFPITIL